MNYASRIGVASLLGFGFGFGGLVLQSLAIFVFVFASSQSWKQTQGVLFTFFAVANIPLLIAAVDYSGLVVFSIVVFLIPPILNTVILGAAMHSSLRYKAVLVLVGMLVLSIPPGIAMNNLSLLSLSGLYFPGMGTVGIAQFCLLVFVLVQRIKLGLLATSFLIAINTATAVAAAPLSSVGIETYRGIDSGIRYAMLERAYRYEELELIESVYEHVVLFPESNYRQWQDTNREVFEGTSKTIYGGARAYVNDTEYVNVIVNAQTGQIVYAQQSPIPMDLPNTHHAVSSSRAKLGVSNEISALICIEASNAWLSFNTFRKKPATVYWVANIGWTEHSWIARRMKNTLAHWSRLYDVPVITAVNYAR